MKIIAAVANPVSLGYMNDIWSHKGALEGAGGMWQEEVSNSWVVATPSFKHFSRGKSCHQQMVGQMLNCNEMHLG